MADILIDNEALPTTPTSGKSVLYVDSTTKKFAQLDDAGVVHGRLSRNFATTSQGAGFAADTYVTNSGLLIPSSGLQAGMTFWWTITGSKTAAGTAQAVYTIRLGTGQSTSDTSIIAFTTAAQTAVADNGILEIMLTLRNTGASAVMAGCVAWSKTQTGSIGLGGSLDAVSSTFNSAGAAGSYLGLSINGGVSAAWTLTSCVAELLA